MPAAPAGSKSRAPFVGSEITPTLRRASSLSRHRPHLRHCGVRGACGLASPRDLLLSSPKPSQERRFGLSLPIMRAIAITTVVTVVMASLILTTFIGFGVIEARTARAIGGGLVLPYLVTLGWLRQRRS